MAVQAETISPSIDSFIKDQKIFFVATAMADGKVNLSPKGMESLKVLAPDRVMWLNLTGSGNETAAHLQHNNRITIMFCSFDLKPLILRLYGTAKVYHPQNKEWNKFIDYFPKNLGARQLIDIKIDMVQTSCGFAVPFMEYKGERDVLAVWAQNKGSKEIEKYWKDKNSTSLDGVDTGI